MMIVGWHPRCYGLRSDEDATLFTTFFVTFSA